jgi:hypothetical protein
LQKVVKKLQKLPKSCQKSCQKVVRKLSKSSQKLSKSSQKLSKVQNSNSNGGWVGWENSSSKAFGISFADRPKAKSELHKEEDELCHRVRDRYEDEVAHTLAHATRSSRCGRQLCKRHERSNM